MLNARADRIDIFADETAHVFDYKTGNNPSVKQAQNLSPQLALEGLIANRSGFAGIDTKTVNSLSFIRLMQGKRFKVESIVSDRSGIDVQTVIEDAGLQLSLLVKAYQSESQGYLSRHAPFLESEMNGDYDHLARVREWSFGTEDENG